MKNTRKFGMIMNNKLKNTFTINKILKLEKQYYKMKHISENKYRISFKISLNKMNYNHSKIKSIFHNNFLNNN